MDSDLSFIEISREDDSLLHLQLQSDDVITTNTKPYFACSPLQKSHSMPAFAGTIGNANAEKIENSSIRGSVDKENVNANKSEMPKLNVEPHQMKRKKKGGYNLRKSLAWDRAFFTEEGVLDPLELSMISGNAGNISGGKLSIIHEEAGESLLESLDRQSDPAHLLTLEEKPSKELATSTPYACKQVAESTPQKHDSVTRFHGPRASAANRKILSNHDINRSGSKRSSCPQPMATQKRPANANTTNKATKELKVSRMPVHSTGSVLPKSTSSSDSITNCSRNAQAVVTSQKNVRPKANAGDKKNVQSKMDVQGSKSSTVKPTLRVSQGIVGKAIHKETSSTKLSSSLEGREGLVKPLVCDALADGRSSNGENPLQQNANQNAKDKQPVQSQIAKPSGLRMPSPSLGFFGQAKDSTTQSLLPRYSQPGLAPQFSISNSRNLSTSKSLVEKRSTCGNESILEVVKTVKSENKRLQSKAGGSATSALNPDSCQKECAEAHPVKSEKKSPADVQIYRDKSTSLPHQGPILVTINNDNKLEDVASRGSISNGTGSATTTKKSLDCIPQTAGVSRNDETLACQPGDRPSSLSEASIICPESHLADASPCRAVSTSKMYDNSVHDITNLSVGQDELLMSSGGANHATNEEEQMMQKEKVMLLDEDGLSEKLLDTRAVQSKDVNPKIQDGSAKELEGYDGQILPEFTISTEVPCASESTCQQSHDDGAGIENTYLEGISSSRSYCATPNTLVIAEPCINSSYRGIVELSPFDCKLYTKNQSHQDSVKLGETASALLVDTFCVEDCWGHDVLMGEHTVSQGSDGCGNGITEPVECKPVEYTLQSTAKSLVIENLSCTDVQSRNADVLHSEDCLFNFKPSSVQDEGPTVVEITDSFGETKLECPNVESHPESIVQKDVGVRPADETVDEAKEDAGYLSCVIDSDVSHNIQLGGGVTYCFADILSADDNLMSHRPDSGQTVEHADQMAFQLREVNEPSPNKKSSTPVGQIHKEGGMTYITSDLNIGGVNEAKKVQSTPHGENADGADESNAHDKSSNYLCMRLEEEELLNKNSVADCCNNLSYITEREQLLVVSRSETVSTQQRQVQEFNACPQIESAAKDNGSDFCGVDEDQQRENETSASDQRKMDNSRNELMEVQYSEEICDLQISETPGMAEGGASPSDRQSTRQHQPHPPFITDEKKSAVEHDSYCKGLVLHDSLDDVAKEEKISSDACQDDNSKIEPSRANACHQVETEPQDTNFDMDRNTEFQRLEDGMSCSKDSMKQNSQDRRRDVHISEETCKLIIPEAPSVANCCAPCPGNGDPLEAHQSRVCNLLETMESNIPQDQHQLKMGTYPIKDENQTVPKEKSLHDKELDAIKVKPPPDAVPFSDEWLAAFEAAGEEILTMKSGKVQNSPPDKPQSEPGPWSPVRRKKNQEIGPYDCTKFTNVNVNLPHSSSQ